MTRHDLSALVSSRICHDLISPIGAISNGVELMQDMGTKASPELGLIGDSVNSASAKLRYFRIAFGATPEAARVQVSELRLATDAMFVGRTRFAFETAPADVPRQTAKLLLLTLLCIEKCLPNGGVITVSLAADAFEVRVCAPRIKPLEAQWAVLEGTQPDDPPAASEVQFFLLAETLGAIRATLERSFGPAEARVAVRGITP